MTGLDWALLVAVLLAAAGGTTQGFLASALGFAGFAGGALLGVRVGPLVLPDGADNVNAPVAALFAATLLGVILGVGLQQIGARIAGRLRRPGGTGLRRAGGMLDAGLGAVFTAALVVAAAWLVAAVLLQSPGLPSSWRAEVRHSKVLRELRRSLPPADDVLSLLARFDPLPGFTGPRAEVKAPDPSIVRVPGARAGRSGVVRVEGSACEVGVVGSGWVVSRGYVVTNQHVIAGESDTTVTPEATGQRLEAYPVYVNETQDIAILAVPGLQVTPLRVSDQPSSGTSAAILGYPLAGPFKARAARIGEAQTVTGENSYGVGPVRRRVLPFRGLVEQGNSGGPLVDRRGRVVGTVFASSTRAGKHSGYAVPNDVIAKALPEIDPNRRVSGGACSH
jgi:S1-C subfamily serine protease